MKVYKFGGASIKNAQAIRNLYAFLAKESTEELVIVVSAMGKTTNALERVVEERIKGNTAKKQLDVIYMFHSAIAEELFNDAEKANQFLQPHFKNLALAANQSINEENFYYDQVVCYGELLSSEIVASYLNFMGYKVQWLDARKFLKTDNNYREVNIDWENTGKNILENLPPLLAEQPVLTQGFIGSDSESNSTTLGREGSDYSAAIFAHFLDASSLTIWKDVPGVLNGDPKIFRRTQKFSELSYQEAAEMTYYGASVIHPKTIKPLADKGIPLYVRSFKHPLEPGTLVQNKLQQLIMPIAILKPNQMLITFRSKDLKFIDENQLGFILQALHQLNIKINLMQNFATSFSICIREQPEKLAMILRQLQAHFDILYTEGLHLITVKHYTATTLSFLRKNFPNVILEQKTRQNLQILVDEVDYEQLGELL